jgi:hypothetical protein
MADSSRKQRRLWRSIMCNHSIYPTGTLEADFSTTFEALGHISQPRTFRWPESSQGKQKMS